MTASVRILTTTSMDSSPSILLIAPDGSRILIDCGEGCQRSFLEYRERLASVRAVCITHLSAKALGGLPGMILTSGNSRNQSSAISAAAAAAAAAAAQSDNVVNKKTQSSSSSLDEQQEQQDLDLTLVGPVGMKDFMHALRHFVWLENFHIQTLEGGAVCDLEIIGKQQQQQLKQRSATNKKMKKKKGSSEAFMNFFITNLVFDDAQRQITTTTAAGATTTTADHDDDVDPSLSSGEKRPRTKMETKSNSITISSQTISYLFTTPPIPGKLQMEKATALGVPIGPLLTQLKAGMTVTFIHKDNGIPQVVHSHQVVTPTSPGIGVLVLRYPICSCANIDDDKKNEHGLKLDRFFQTLHLPDLMRSKGVQVELVLHLCTQSDFESEAAVAWRNSLQHALNCGDISGGGGQAGSDDIVAGAVGIIQHVVVDTEPNADYNGSPHLGAAVMAQTRAMLSSDIYLTLSPSPSSSTTGEEERSSCNSKGEAINCHVMNGKDNGGSSENDIVVLARPKLEYILLPRSKRGLVREQVNGPDVEQHKIATAQEFVTESGAKSLAESVLSECGDIACSSAPSSLDNNLMGQLIFAGTASAIPCKYRNVTGMCLTDKLGRNMLLDIGEGTIGQLLRVHHHHHDSSKQSLLSSITAVWISHPHADHHLGILRLLEERQQQQQQSMTTSIDPVVIIAPPPIFDFLREYSLIVPAVANSYHAIDCREFQRPHQLQNNTDALAKLQSAFQVTGCRSVLVQHCLFSYAVILEGTSFGTLVYSGDCRPNHGLAKEAPGADVLIHEATFEDGMEAEAALKRHCTVGEALRVAQEMQAKCLVLTHFSQRYPKIPPTPAMFSSNNQETATSASSIPIIFAFDFMRLTPQNLLAASKLTPALRLLYSSDGGDEDDMETAIDGGPSNNAEIALSVPGLFAQSNLL